MDDKKHLVVTSIASPNEVLSKLAWGCQEKGYKFVLIGDEASPKDFQLEGCDFYGLNRQRQMDFEFARICPTRHYARKNIGYLLAIADGASIIIETDDDNIPKENFWRERQRMCKCPKLQNGNWVNVYGYFSEANIWPRGFPLEHLSKQAPAYESLSESEADCPIQQNLADDNPDVDAVYRLTMPLPQSFRQDRRVALAEGSWCPFNSQNTTWWPDAFKLMYLPAYCSFRMTDIWRSFIAQRIAWSNGWSVLFGPATMRQERNVHNLMRDFEDEIPGYLNNTAICQTLEKLPLQSGTERISDNLRICYEKLIDMSLVKAEELKLLDAWLRDIEQLK
jgi:hypothetical protein